MPQPPPKNKADIIFQAENATYFCKGYWDLPGISTLSPQLDALPLPDSKAITIDGSQISHMDTSGAWEIAKLIRYLRNQGYQIHLQGFNPEQQKLLEMIEKQAKQLQFTSDEITETNLEHLGKKTVHALNEFTEYLAFIGEVAVVAIRGFKNPRRLHWSYLARTLETTGYQALPIIALLSFMIGVVLAYQIGLQLRNYGAQIFVVDLLGASILREFGILITAIIVAGRSGSAFTAQLGTMKLNEEIDALSTMGLVPAQLLVLPRIIGLTIALPLLTIWANFFGVLGGMLMTQGMFNMGLHDFVTRFEQAITINSLLIGLGKAPVFALLIASIGCFQGMQVSGGAESVGERTTKSVVQAIFMIIVADAAFSVIFSKLNL